MKIAAADRLTPHRLALRLLALAMSVVALPALGADLIREEQRIIVGEEEEIWRLVWPTPPIPACPPEEVSSAITSPCSGFAYGEKGDLTLVRLRASREVERMSLVPLFAIFDHLPEVNERSIAYLARWPTEPDDLHRDNIDDPTLVAEIRQRPIQPVMRFADYDGDGRATEFLIQVGTLPCGKHQFAAVGVGDPGGRLRSLTTAAHPERPLVMPLNAWEALRGNPRQSTVPTWECGDHGSERRTELLVAAEGGRIRARNRSFSCPEDDSPEKLMEEEVW